MKKTGVLHLDRNVGKFIFGLVRAQVQVEMETHFKSKKIPGLEKIDFKLIATGGTGGFNLTGGIDPARQLTAGLRSTTKLASLYT